MPPRDIAALQRAVGNQAVQRMLATRPASMVQRTLDPDAMLGVLDTIPLVKQKLDQTLLRRQAAMRVHIQQVLENYRKQFKTGHSQVTNHAMMIALVVDAVARVITEELHDISIKPQVAAKLIATYGPQLQAELMAKTGDASDADSKKALSLAGKIAGDDPLSLYMHGELALEVADRRVRAMAADAGIGPAKMFRLLSERFQSEMGAFTQARVRAEEDKKDQYNIKDTTGEVSQEYFGQLFGTRDPTWKAGTSGARGVNLEAGAAQKLANLEAALSQPVPAAGPVVAPRAGLTGKQERHFQNIEAAEVAAAVGVKGRVARKLMEIYFLTQAEATALVDKIEAWLPAQPLTITVKVNDWFGDHIPQVADRSALYEPALARDITPKSYSTIFNDPAATGSVDVLHTDTPSFGNSRGDDYWRFRRTKDQKGTGGQDFSLQEMPVFGAVNTSHWGQLKGGNPRMNLAPGANDYGDCTFLLNKDRVRNRVLYTATAAGAPRRNLLLVVEDFIAQHQQHGTRAARLQGNEKTNELLKSNAALEGLNQIVGNASAIDNVVFGGSLKLEMQIFGPIDITQDVETIYYTSGIDAAAKSNLEAFFWSTGVPIEQVDPPHGVEIVETRGNRPDTKKALAAARGLDVRGVTADAQEGKLAEFQIAYEQARRLLTTAAAAVAERRAAVDHAITAFQNVPPSQKEQVQVFGAALLRRRAALLAAPVGP